MKRSSRLLIVLVAMVVATQGFCGAAPEGTDWHQWRGPNRDGTTPVSDWNPEALNDLRILWQSNVGVGNSSPVIAGRNLYITGTIDEDDTIHCLRADNGKTAWSRVMDKGEFIGLRGDERAAINSSLSTGLIDGANLYVVASLGNLFCLRRESGDVVWRKHLTKDYGAVMPMNGWCVSPAITGDLLILNAGMYGLALDKHSGELI